MKNIIILMSLFLAFCAILPAEDYPEPFTLPPEAYTNTTIISIGTEPTNIKTYLPRPFRNGAATFDPPIIWEGMSTSQMTFGGNDAPIIVSGPSTMTIRWNE